MQVLLTGAHGTVGTAVTAHSDHEYTLLDVDDPEATLADGTPHPHRERAGETAIVDVGAPDAVSEIAEVAAGHDAIVHLAGNPAVSTPYDRVERNNVRGTRNVLEAAVEADVGTVVFSSSNHTVGMYEEEHAPALYDPDYHLTVDHESPLRPDSDYGASKVAGEAWGRLYAEREGIDFYALRIGTILAPAYDHPFGTAERGVERGEWERGSDAYEERVARVRCTWQSRRDAAHLVDCCLADGAEGGASAETVAGGTFEILYGISDNPASWFDVSDATERVGYDPQDSGADYTEPPR